ncbi:MAG: DeoR/GlpR family DNA-binding transcription regulator [Deltaproteobacteria bacterium]|jgi:DeoR/GlpR family transcriptional regulator of sugar metabolism|nr:DeoR/GlpR family DNA-binding transcription regulator [Deltaproteobacteria bacterium]
MLPARRRSQMALYIQQNGGVDTETLARHFGVSVMTARRDLKVLEEQNVLKITWGGALPMNFLPREIPYANKAAAMREAKKAIAAVAAGLVREESCIMLDAGTTTLELAERLCGRTLTVITNDLQIALFLASSPTVAVHFAGGWVDPVSRSCNDESTLEFLRRLNVTQAFIGASVWDASRGATTSSTAKMRTKQRMLACAGEGVLLADSSKYGNFSPWTVAGLTEFSCIVTDSGLRDAARDAVAHSGAVLRVAPLFPGRETAEAGRR